MKIYTCTQFQGYYPVGAAAIVVAKNAEEAAQMLTNRLAVMGLPQIIGVSHMEGVLSSVPSVTILCDGNY